MLSGMRALFLGAMILFGCGGEVQAVDQLPGLPVDASSDAGACTVMRCERVDGPDCRPYPGKCKACDFCAATWGPDVQCVELACPAN